MMRAKEGGEGVQKKAYIEKVYGRQTGTDDNRARLKKIPTSHAFSDNSHGVRIGRDQKTKEGNTLYDLVEMLP